MSCNNQLSRSLLVKIYEFILLIAIAPHERYQIQKQAEKSTAALEQVESRIEQETDKLIYLED